MGLNYTDKFTKKTKKKPFCHNIPDHHIKLINPLSQRLVGEDSSIPYDDACLTAHTVKQTKCNIMMWYYITLVIYSICFLEGK